MAATLIPQPGSFLPRILFSLTLSDSRSLYNPRTPSPSSPPVLHPNPHFISQFSSSELSAFASLRQFKDRKHREKKESLHERRLRSGTSHIAAAALRLRRSTVEIKKKLFTCCFPLQAGKWSQLDENKVTVLERRRSTPILIQQFCV